MKPAQDLTGLLFGSWHVLGRSNKRTKGDTVHFICKCRCGVTKSVSSKLLRYGRSKSCSRCAQLALSDRSPAAIMDKLERRRARQRARYAANREAICKWWADYRAANLDHVNALERKRYRLHVEAKAELAEVFAEG